MMDVAIIGAGRMGTSLGRALVKKGFRIRGLCCRSLQSARQSQKIIEEGKISLSPADAARKAEVVFLCLPDDAVASVVKELSRSKIHWSKKYVFHSSGVFSSEILNPLKSQGASIASFHPIQSFSQKETPPRHFSRIFFGIEGDKKALALARNIIAKLGGRPLLVNKQARADYHAGLSVGSNFLVVLLNMAIRLLKEAGIGEKRAVQVLLPLLQGTLHNVKKFNIIDSLTGPIIRGDVESVTSHLKSLEKFPLDREAYKKLGRLALEMAKKQGLPPRKARALKKLLEDK